MRRIVSFFLLLALLCASLPALGETVPEGAATQIVLTFTGDCTLGCDAKERGSTSSFETYIEKYGYGYPFEKVKQFFEQDDLTVINLEGTLYDFDANPKPNSNYHFRGPTDYVNILTESSIEACSLANNHMMDYGVAGLQSTIQTLENAGVHWFGTINNGAAASYVFEKDGVKIGFVSVYISDWWVPGTPTAIKNQIQAMKDGGCSLVIACMHAGVEYDKRHDKNQEKMADQLIRYGAQIVVGHHPHAIQGIREANGICTLWSLGNFAFGGNTGVYVSRKKNAHYGEINLISCIAQFTLSFDQGGRYLGHQLNLIPCHVSGTVDYNNYQPVPVTGAEAENVIKAIRDDSSPRRLNPFAEGVGAVQDFVPAPMQ